MPPNTNPLESRARYGTISWSNHFHVAYIFIRMPVVLAFNAIFGPKHARAYAQKPLKRRVADALGRSMSGLKVAEIQWMLGSGLDIYRTWAERQKLDCSIVNLDLDLEDHAHNHLYWIDEKRTDKVILYLPGGAHHFPATAMMLKFWRYLQLEWRKQDLDVGIAVVSYTILPEGGFPHQLRQAVSALEHLFAIGCKPSNIQLVGDSAGGNVIAQLLSHILHPLPNVRPSSLPSNERFRGVYLMSPWVSLSKPEEWGGWDESFNAKATKALSRSYMAQVSDSQLAHADPILVPDDWYKGLSSIIDRIFISSGSEELFLNQDIVFYEKKVKPHMEDARLEVQEGGQHDDPLMDFFLYNEPLENTLTPIIVEWIAKGFQ